jgi:ElaB/YqjD/DUF883 family membrane-anchored ribosome-binding protein
LNRLILKLSPEAETMTTETRNDQNIDDSMTSVNEAAKKADGAIRDTAQKYVDRSGIKFDLQQIEQTIREKPLPAVAIAAAAGSSLAAVWSRAWAWQCLHYSVAKPPEKRRVISSAA